jgi:hypothetical protein
MSFDACLRYILCMQDPHRCRVARTVLEFAWDAPRLAAALLAGGALSALLDGLQADAEVWHCGS